MLDSACSFLWASWYFLRVESRIMAISWAFVASSSLTAIFAISLAGGVTLTWKLPLSKSSIMNVIFAILIVTIGLEDRQGPLSLLVG